MKELPVVHGKNPGAQVEIGDREEIFEKIEAQLTWSGSTSPTCGGLPVYMNFRCCRNSFKTDALFTYTS